MKRGFFFFSLFFMIVLFTSGCSDLSKLSISDYYETYSSAALDEYSVKYKVTTVNDESATGYAVVNVLPAPSFTLYAKPKGTLPDATMPTISLNKIKVAYTIISDTQGNLMG